MCSISLPACFVLKLNEPMAVSVEACRRIRQLSEATAGRSAGAVFSFDESKAMPLMALVTKNKSGGQLETGNSRGLFVVR